MSWFVWSFVCPAFSALCLSHRFIVWCFWKSHLSFVDPTLASQTFYYALILNYTPWSIFSSLSTSNWDLLLECVSTLTWVPMVHYCYTPRTVKCDITHPVPFKSIPHDETRHASTAVCKIVKTGSTPELFPEHLEISVRQHLASATQRGVLHPCQVFVDFRT